MPRARSGRFEGPYIETLTLDDVKQCLNAKCKWEAFFHEKRGMRVSDCYSLPGSVQALLERTEENIMSYMSCYWVLCKLLAVVYAYTHVKATLGLVALLLLSDGWLEAVGGQASLLLTNSRYVTHGNVMAMFAAASSLLSVGIVLWSGALHAVSKWVLACCAAVLLHAVTRRAPTEMQLRMSQQPVQRRRLWSRWRPQRRFEELPPEGGWLLLLDVVGMLQLHAERALRDASDYFQLMGYRAWRKQHYY